MKKLEYFSFVGMHIIIGGLFILATIQMINATVFSSKYNIYDPLLVVLLYAHFWVFFGSVIITIVDKMEVK